MIFRFSFLVSIQLSYLGTLGQSNELLIATPEGFIYDVKDIGTLLSVPTGTVTSLSSVVIQSSEWIAISSPNNLVRGVCPGDQPCTVVRLYPAITVATEIAAFYYYSPGSVVSDQFGASLSIFDQVLIVGAPQYGSSGRVYVFPISASDLFTPTQIIDSSGASFQSQFGQSVAFNGLNILIGAPGVKEGGAAYMYSIPISGGGKFSLIEKLTNPSSDSQFNFGISVAISFNFAIVGTTSGAAYVYARSNTGQWTIINILLPKGGTVVTSTFGISVSVIDGVAAVCDSGTGYVYFFAGTSSLGSWTQTARFSTGYYNFANSISLTASAQYGVKAEAAVGSSAGAVFMYYLSSQPGHGWYYSNVAFNCPMECPVKYSGQCINNVNLIPGMLLCASPYTGEVRQVSTVTLPPSTQQPTAPLRIVQGPGIIYNIHSTTVQSVGAVGNTAAAVSNEYLVVSAPNYLGSIPSEVIPVTYVTVEVRSTGVTYAVSATTAVADVFGAGLAVAGNTLFVAATGRGPYGTVFVFTLGTTSAQLIQAIIGPVSRANFGASVAARNNYLIIGSDNAALGNGSAYIYVVDVNGIYTLQAALVNPKIAYKMFGQSVAIASQAAIVGASGAAYIYEVSVSGVWNLQSSLLPSSFSASFGGTVSIIDDYAAVGDVLNGNAYLYTKSTIANCWILSSKLSSPNVSPGFGSSIALSASVQFDVLAEATIATTESNYLLYVFRRNKWLFGNVSVSCPVVCPYSTLGSCTVSVVIAQGYAVCNSAATAEVYKTWYSIVEPSRSSFYPSTYQTLAPATSHSSTLPTASPTSDILFSGLGVVYSFHYPWPTNMYSSDGHPSVGSVVAMTSDFIAFMNPNYVHGYTAIKVVDRATGLSYFALAGTSVAETFGSSIAILENTMVVGASTCGKLFVFALGSTNSTLVQAIVGPVAGSSFGQSVGLSTSYIIVGAPSAANGGMVYIYTANVNVKGSYTLQAALTNPNILYTTYGLSVAIASRTAVVGANGAAYVYGLISDAWTLLDTLLPTGSNPLGSQLGYSVSTLDGMAAVGDPAKSWAYFYSGSTIVGSWTLITRIRVPYINSGSSVIIAASNKTGILYEGVIGSLQGAYAFVAFQQGTWNYLHTGFLCPNFCTSVVTVQCSNNMAFIPGTAVCNSPYSGSATIRSYSIIENVSHPLAGLLQ